MRSFFMKDANERLRQKPIMLTHDHENLLARYFSGEATAQERAEIETWRRASSENQRAFAEFEKIWQSARAEQQPEIPNIDQAWLELESKLGLPNEQPRARILEMKKAPPIAPPSRVFAWRGRSMLAAAAILLLAFSAILYKTWQGSPQLQTITTAHAEQRQLDLPDGSKVTLNSGSTLQYPKEFASESREVALSGEAFFEVARDAEHPFLVHTANAQIKVLGTKFGIWSREQETRVIVREGLVALRGKKGEPGAGVELTANQMSVLRNREMPAPGRSIDANYALGWLEGRIVFEQASLAEVTAELERVYNVEIALAEARLAQNTITGSFNRKPVESVLASICLTLNLHYRQQEGRYIISE